MEQRAWSMGQGAQERGIKVEVVENVENVENVEKGEVVEVVLKI